MKKFSKIFESKGDLLSKLSTTEEEIKDMCSDLIDEGYEFTIDIEYIGLNGQIYQESDQTKQYYPSIDIELHRPTSEKDDDYDTKTKEKFKDVRNWNGGVYYEGNLNLLKSVYDICYRFESTFSSDKADVFFSMRSINEISIRITFGVENSKAPIDFSDIKEYIRNGFLNSIDDEDYRVIDNFIWGDDRKMSVEIAHKRDDSPIRRIINRIITSGEKNDEDYLREVFKRCVHDLFKYCQSKNNKLKLKWYHIREIGENATICLGNIVLIKLNIDFETIGEKDIVVAKGIFKDKKTKIEILKMTIGVKFSDDYITAEN